MDIVVDVAIILVLLGGIAQFRSPPGARRGNLTAAAALAAALVVVLVRNPITGVPWVVVAAVVGIIFGGWVALRVTMIRIPAMVAFQHGAGGVAAFVVSFVELVLLATQQAPGREVAALLGLFIGAATFSGSMIASGKLAGRLRQTPTVLSGHNRLLVVALAAAAVLAIWGGLVHQAAARTGVLVVLIAVSVVVGILVAIRVGGADMPVLISFLNATAGLAAALCGIAMKSQLLTACGATVAASGSVLTHVMCRSMNRGLRSVFTGLQVAPAGPPLAPVPQSTEPPAAPEATTEKRAEIPAVAAAPPADPAEKAAESLREAQRIIIIPGYGMALADAQGDLVELAEHLVSLGKDVKFAIHPVAGRMPGHMHVLLAEAELDYGKLFEMKDINDEFAAADVALVVGACDVVNPAAIQSANTPISGMPILKAYEAKHVIVCNLDERPGYSGVENPLYKDPRTIMLLGDAKESLGKVRGRL